MTGETVSPGGAIRRLVDTAWSANSASADPDDPRVRAFAEFGLPSSSALARDDELHNLATWQHGLQISANSAFVDGTLLLTVEALLDWDDPEVLTPVTLWELTTFIDALVCFDRLYCIANPIIDVARFNQRLGAEVLTAIPDPEGGMLRRIAANAASDGLSSMSHLSSRTGRDDAWGQEVQAVVEGWRAVLGQDFPDDGPFDAANVIFGFAGTGGPSAGPPQGALSATSYPFPPSLPPATSYPPPKPPSGGFPPPPATFYPPAPLPREVPLPPGSSPRTGLRTSAILADGIGAGSKAQQQLLQILIEATRLPTTPAVPVNRPPLPARQHFASTATYRTYVNQGIANALALPYLPGTLRMPYRRLFVKRAGEVQDELVSVALADHVFAQQQPSSPLILPFFTAAVLQRATTREAIWAQMAKVRHQSTPFRRVRADLDRMLERSQISAEAIRFQSAIRDEALKLADLAGATQQSASFAIGVIAQTGIVPLVGALKVGVDAARGVGRDNSWTRIWRRLFHRHEYFLAQTNTQAAALTNALPQLQQLWQMPKIGGYLMQFANATQHIGHVLRD